MTNLETNKLFVGNLHWDIRRQDLKEFFGEFGPVSYTSVALDRETGKSRGFGFVTFENAEDAKTAHTEANEKELNGRKIYLDFAKSRDDDVAPAAAEEETQEEEKKEIQETEQ